MSPKNHTCTVCGYTGPWDDRWTWYGSYKQLDEDPKSIIKVCSKQCRDKAKEDGLVPKNAAMEEES